MPGQDIKTELRVEGLPRGFAIITLLHREGQRKTRNQAFSTNQYELYIQGCKVSAASKISSSSNGERQQKRSSMITIIALTTLASMSLTACSQPSQSSKDEEKKEENQTASSSHSHFHGSHGNGATVHVAAKDRQSRQYTNQKSQPKNSISQRGAYNPAPAPASGGISRGWFGRFFGSIFGG